MKDNSSPHKFGFGVLFGIATFLGLLFTLQTYLAYVGTQQHFQWAVQVTTAMGTFYLWALFFPFIYSLAERFRLEPGSYAKNLSICLLVGALLAALNGGVIALLNDRFFPPGGNHQTLGQIFNETFIGTWLWRLFLFGAILSICMALDFYRRSRETEIQTGRIENAILLAKIESLKMQMDPDFLFNSLRSLRGLIHTNPDGADTMIARLGDYLRINLDHAGISVVTLREEVEFLRCYLEIENNMTSHPSDIELDVDSSAWDCKVPILILQAPVEDAIRARKDNSSLLLKILARKLESVLVISLNDPSNGSIDSAQPRLVQLLERLNDYYKTPIRLDTAVQNDQKTTLIEVPLSLEKREPDETASSEPLAEENGTDSDWVDSSNPVSKWLLIIGVFTFLAIYFTFQTMLLQASKGASIDWPVQLLNITGWYVWALITPIVLKISARFPLQKKNFFKHLGIHFLGFLSTWIVANLLYAAVRWAGNLGQISYVSLLSPARYIGLDIVCYSTIVAIESALRYHRKLESGKLRTVRLNSQLARARLQALKMQLHPHFLFNALNSLSQLMREDLSAAEEMIVNLEKFLRLTLGSNDTQEIPLEGELEFLNCYLAIENIRFQDRLKIKINIDPEALKVMVPNLVLQPIVENAIKHGVAPRVTPGEVEIIATRKNGTLTVSVRDDGPGLTRSQKKMISARPGLGLSNTRERLIQMYGNSHRFELTNAPEGGLLVTLEIPIDRELHDTTRLAS